MEFSLDIANKKIIMGFERNTTSYTPRLTLNSINKTAVCTLLSCTRFYNKSNLGESNTPTSQNYGLYIE